ncbi:restriction endonuclease subunit S [Thauera sp. 2A1]|uniref:restriction endonuclease subunit S n=1 Tax=Thauera sp. 2A1 TaxID=2570191 RepID=UPI0012911961|nr:restriction endonuclease subunit S [Thauera sp. 2A1]KAI5912632.1 restriction endonuclease subunit S [Thauera sp. 2A1]
MDAQQFLAEFGHIANAPGGVARLRELVLALAVQGRLVQQDPSDEPATKQVERIKTIALTTTTAGKRKKTAATSHHDGAAASQLPRGWANTRLCELARVLNGRAYSKQELLASGTPVLRVGNLFTSDHWYYSNLELEDDKYCDAGDLLYAWSASFGPFIWHGKRVIYHYHIWKLDLFSSEEVDKRFLHTWLLEKTQEIKAAGHGISMAHMTKEKFEQLVIALPPLQEQSRIVAKVDELMALCDRLEAQQQDRRKLQNALRQSTLQALASAQSPHELQDSWKRLQANFGRLFSESGDVSDLRKSILDLAVSGCLSSINESDQSATSLKETILAAKEAGISSGTVVRKKHVKPEELQETALPSHWESITLDEAISTIDAGWSPACMPNARDDESKWGVLKTTSVQVLRFLPHEHKELPASLDPRPQYQIAVGDILITRAGPKNRVGICCVVDDAPPRLMISDKLIRFHIVDDLIDPHFVALCLSAGEPGRIVERLKSGMAESQMNISQDKLRSITIPLPPLEEQQRVLKKVEALMRIIDVLEAQLNKSQVVSGKVAAAAVAALTGITIEQEEAPVKVPQTELIALLRLGTPGTSQDSCRLIHATDRFKSSACT